MAAIVVLLMVLLGLSQWRADNDITTSVRLGQDAVIKPAIVPEAVVRSVARKSVSRFVPGQLLVGFEPSLTDARRDQLLAGIGARIAPNFQTSNLALTGSVQLIELADGLSVDAAVRYFSSHAGVRFAEPNVIYRARAVPNDRLYFRQWGLTGSSDSGARDLAGIEIEGAWDAVTGSKRVVIGVIDSGIDLGHGDLRSNRWNNPFDIRNNGIDDDNNGWIDDEYGINTISNNGNPQDTTGHGTHVAGIIAAEGNNGIGVSGVMMAASIISCKFLSSDGSGTLANAVRCLDYFAELKHRGVNIIATNNSWGGPDPAQALEEAIDAHRRLGILFVAAAGDEGLDIDVHNDYPSSYPLDNIISVAASAPDDGMASFSNFGLNTVDIVAPGVSIYSTLPGGQHGYNSGTSMAAPFVTGALGLLSAYSPTLDTASLRNQLFESSRVDYRLTDRIANGRRLRLRLPTRDVDQDSMPDTWEAANGLDPNTAADAVFDYDNDGLSNLEEFRRDTNPRVADTDGDGLSDGDEVFVYETDPTRVDSDADGISDSQEIEQYDSDPLAADTDGDGLTDGNEISLLGTSPTAVDTDGDGLDDDWEDDFGLDPTVATDTNVDSDNDGLDLAAEFAAGTNPLDADTDGDGLSDGEEVENIGSDPRNSDSDQDGMPDGWEVDAQLDPLNDADAALDSDGDGFSNVTEFRRGSNPNDPLSVPSVASWSTFQGGPSLSGHLDLVTDPSLFETLWTRTLDGSAATQVAVTARQMVLSQNDFRSDQNLRKVTALELARGQTLWSTSLDEFSSIGGVHLSAAHLHVPVVRVGQGGGSLIALDVASGLRAGIGARSGSALYLDMITDSNRIFIKDLGDLVSVEAATGNVLWSVPLPAGAQLRGWKPVVYEDLVIVAYDGRFGAFDRDNGAQLFDHSIGECSAGSATQMAVTGNGIAVFQQSGCVAAFDLVQQQPLWSISEADPAATMAVDEDALYVRQGLGLSALDTATGEVLWRWSEGEPQRNLLSTASHVFVSTDQGTFAVGRQSGQTEWSDPAQGFLSVSAAGLLLIADVSDPVTIKAFNMEGDSDGDGLPNWWERFYNLDFADPSDAALDADSDGVSNLQEFVHGLDPRNADTDEDQLNDRQEIDLGSDPLAQDSDGDGLDDGAEVLVYGSDPTEPDTDGDGLGDGEEVNSWDTDPTDASSFPAGTELFATSFENGVPPRWLTPENAEAIWAVSDSAASDGYFSLQTKNTMAGTAIIEWDTYFADGELSFDASTGSFPCCGVMLVYVDDELPFRIAEPSWKRFGFFLPRGRHTIRFERRENQLGRNAMIDNVRFEPLQPFISSTQQLVIADSQNIAQYTRTGRVSRFPLPVPEATDIRAVAITGDRRLALYDAPVLHVFDPVSETFSRFAVNGWEPPPSRGGTIESVGNFIYASDHGENGGLRRFTLDGFYVDHVAQGAVYSDLEVTVDGALYGLTNGRLVQLDLDTFAVLSETPLVSAPVNVVISRGNSTTYGTRFPDSISRYNEAGLRGENVNATGDSRLLDAAELPGGDMVFVGSGELLHVVDPAFENYRTYALTQHLDGNDLSLAAISRPGFDTDGDGAPDWWETLNGLNPGLADDGALDSDSDGLVNVLEFEHGTSVTLADSDSDGLSDGDEVLLYNTDPAEFDTDRDGLSDRDEVLIHGTNPKSADSDRDGLTDLAEINALGTDPTLADTDGDGIDDALELDLGLDPNNAADATEDMDGDGLNNTQELAAGTMVGDDDTDADGLSDWAEINEHGTDPLSEDSDGDRILDSFEVNEGLLPLDASDALLDSDGDGFANVVEYYADSSLLDPNAMPRAQAWSGHRGGASRTGYVPLIIDASQIAPLWSRSLLIPSESDRQIVTGGHDAVFIDDLDIGTPTNLVSVNALDGSARWERYLGFNNFLAVQDTPLLTRRSVFVLPRSRNPILIDRNTGAQIDVDTESTVVDGWRRRGSTLYDGDLYVYTVDSVIQRVDAHSGEVRWQSDRVVVVSESDIAVDDSYVYVYAGDTNEFSRGLVAYWRDSGKFAFRLGDLGQFIFGASGSAGPILDGKGSVYLRHRHGRIQAFGKRRPNFKWRSSRSFTGAPAFANGLIFAVDGNELVALNSTNGQFVWSWRAPADLVDSPLATVNHVFVNTADATYAIDIATQSRVWSAPGTGALSIGANRILMRADKNGTLDAFRTYADSDNDGLPDDWELANGLDPAMASDANQDADGDGLNNADEYLRGTHPNLADSDDDGLSDGDEINIHETDASRADTDQDGLSDSDELFVYGSNPDRADTDNDGLSDAEEALTFGTNPNAADTDDDGALDSWELEWAGDPLDPQVAPATQPMQQYSFEDDADIAPWTIEPGNASTWQVAADQNAYDGTHVLIPLSLSPGEQTALVYEGFFPDSALSLLVRGATCNEQIRVSVDGEPYYGSSSNLWRRVVIPLSYGPHRIELRADSGCAVTETADQMAVDLVRLTAPDSDLDGLPDHIELSAGLDPQAAWDARRDLDDDGLMNLREFDLGTDIARADTDDDSMRDGWEVTFALDPLVDDRDLDADEDGLTNGREHEFNSNPRNSDTDNDGMPDGYEADNNLFVLSNDAVQDPDSDGLQNLEEYVAGTSPHDPDSEGDGMHDGWEITYGFDPLAADGIGDPDQDALVNRAEFEAGTLPRVADSDSDVIPDGYEVQNDLNPLRRDAQEDLDGDELANIAEYELGTAANSADTDNDGMPDGWEVSFELDPLMDDAAQDPDGDQANNLAEFQRGTNPKAADPVVQPPPPSSGGGGGFGPVELSMYLGLLALQYRRRRLRLDQVGANSSR